MVTPFKIFLKALPIHSSTYASPTPKNEGVDRNGTDWGSFWFHEINEICYFPTLQWLVLSNSMLKFVNRRGYLDFLLFRFPKTKSFGTTSIRSLNQSAKAIFLFYWTHQSIRWRISEQTVYMMGTVDMDKLFPIKIFFCN